MRQLVRIIVVLVYVIFAEEDAKLHQLQSLTDTVNLWDPEWDKFKQYVVDGPRNYTVVVFFTSESDELKCAACPVLREQMILLTQWYNSDVPKNERDIFFVSAEWTRNSQVFRNYHNKIQTMPSIIIIKSTKKKGSQFKFEDRDKILMQSEVTAVYLSQRINARLGVAKINPPVPSLLPQYLAGGTVAVIILLILHHYRQKTVIWLVISLLFPWFTYTGTFFNLNSNPPFIYHNPPNQMIIIWPSQQMQTVLEGLLMSTLIITIGVGFAVLGTYVPTLPYSRRRITFWIFVVILSGLIYLFTRVWHIKNPSYLTYS